MQLLFSFTVGGAEKLVVDLSNQLIKRGHEVHVYVVNDLYDESMLELLSDQIKVVLQKRAVSGHAKIKTIKCITKYIIDERIEIVHCNSFSAPNLLCLKPMFFKKTKANNSCVSSRKSCRLFLLFSRFVVILFLLYCAELSGATFSFWPGT